MYASYSRYSRGKTVDAGSKPTFEKMSVLPLPPPPRATCTQDNPLAKARGLSTRTAGKPWYNYYEFDLSGTVRTAQALIRLPKLKQVM